LKSRSLRALLAVIASLAFAQSAHATLLTGSVSGLVTSAGALVPGVTTGSIVTGSFTYDTSITVNDIFGAIHPLTAFTLSIGTNPLHFVLSDLRLDTDVIPGVATNPPTPLANKLQFFFQFLSIGNFVGAAVNSETILSSSTPEIFTISSDNPAHSFTFNFAASPGVAAVAVPEPATTALFGIGCVALLAGVARRGRQAIHA
jgi:hypothetical protein